LPRLSGLTACWDWLRLLLGCGRRGRARVEGVGRGGPTRRGGVPQLLLQTPIAVPPRWEALPQLNRALATRLLSVLVERMITTGGGGRPPPAGPVRGGGDQGERAGEVSAEAAGRQGPVVAS
jgi:hypothetical protein